MKEWVYGRNTIQALLQSHRIQEIIVLKNTNQDLLKIIKKNKITYRMSDNRQELTKIVHNQSHQGIIAYIESYDYTPLSTILKNIPQNKTPLLLMLDGIEDPHNLGAILRTCDAVGVDGIIIKKNRNVGLNATVAKVSTGAIDYIPVAQVTNLTRTLDDLKKQGYWVVGCEVEESVDYRTVDYNMPCVLVIGSEGKGISRLVKENCDIKVVIPMDGHVNSLNASVATAVLLYQVYQSRHPL